MLAAGTSGDSPAGRRSGRAWKLAAAIAALVAAAGDGDQLLLFSILEHSMFLSLRKTDCFTSICNPVQQCIRKDNANLMEVHWRRMSLSCGHMEKGSM